MEIPGDSFTFNGKNSYTDFGVKIVAYDTLKPKKRARFIEIPLIDGKYDLGAKNFENREFSMDCTWENTGVERPKEHFREIAYWLSKKSNLFFWNEPDKYYKGTFYESNVVTDSMGEVLKKFTLKFVGEPYAYSTYTEDTLLYGANDINYIGTATTPTIIKIKNNGSTSITNIKLRVAKTGGD